MLTIRLTRKGKKNQPFFRVVVIDKRSSTKGGRAVEDLGYVDPLKKRKNFKKDRILYWISKGAQTSATVHNFLVSEKIIDDKKIHVSKLSKKKQAEINSAKSTEVGATSDVAPTETPAEAEQPVEPEAPAEPTGEAPSNDGVTPASVEDSGEAKEPEKELPAPEEPAQSPADNEAGKEPKPEETPNE